MKSWKLTAAALGAAALALIGGQAASAQTPLNILGAGSSAVVNAALQAAVNQNGNGTLYYSGNINIPSAGIANKTQFTTSNTAALSEPGGVTTNSTTWFVYISGAATVADVSYDSTVGNRSLFNSETIKTTTGTAAVDNVFNGTTAVNVAFTDIRPEDALFATNRVLALGYSASNPIKDLFGNSFAPVPFTLNSTFITNPIGAAAIVVAVNASTSGSSSVLANASNVNRATLANILSGNLVHVGDLVPTATAATPFLTTYVREPISGTYNTTEFCTVATVEGQLSSQTLTQEFNVSSTASNPLNEAGVVASGSNFGSFSGGTSNGGRVRAIGTGQLVKVLNQTPNALGYAFYSVENFNPTAGSVGGATANANNLRYLTVDGVDPLKDTYSGGTFDTGTQVNLDNVANGSYPAWSVIRAITKTVPSGDTATFLTSSLPSANGGTKDFIPANQLLVFRSHRNLAPQTGSSSGIIANDGVLTAGTEKGSDVGGQIFLRVDEMDYNADFGGTFTGARQ